MWVLIALWAGLLQSARNGFARSLVGSISPVLNSWAYSLTFVAYVKAVGQVESVAAVLYSLLIWKESEVSRQVPGMALTLVGIVLVLLGGSPA
jgi:drug/metabolite transporter (DMT)-like permease